MVVVAANAGPRLAGPKPGSYIPGIFFVPTRSLLHLSVTHLARPLDFSETVCLGQRS